MQVIKIQLGGYLYFPSFWRNSQLLCLVDYRLHLQVSKVSKVNSLAYTAAKRIFCSGLEYT